jgi:hypothetical protein
MRNSKTFKYFISATSIALILSLLLTATVVADDTPPPTEEPASSEEESLLVSEDPLFLPEIPEEFPEEIPIIVLVDEQIEPLATQQALNAFVIGDPIWCPVGIPPNPGAGGCTATYANLTLLITAIENLDIPEPAADGVIWITDGIDTSPSTVIIDGSPFGFSTWTNFQLTLQGGWDGSPAGTIIGSTTFSVPLWILDWGAPVTINNINVNGTGSTGLYVESSGDVSLNGVSVSGNTGAGLFVDAGANINAQNLSAANNDTGASLFAGNDISLTGTNQFDNNTNSGLYADAGGDINAENLSAVGNGLGGVSLNAVGNISVAGTNIFNSNSGGIGLYADAGGNIAAENLSAEGNNTGSLLLSGGDILLTGSSEFNNNTTSGLYADAGAGINAENLNATGNGTDGVILNAVGSIALAGTNVFNANAGGIGLYVDAGGDITAENLSAEGNNSGSLLLSGGDISLTGTSEFNNNTTSGLYADAGGDINAENLSAVGNGLDGVSLNAVGNISLTGANIFNANAGGIGLYADAGGDIDVENVTAGGNGFSGANLTSGGDVSVTGSNAMNTNAGYGLFVDAGGDIDVESISAGGNGLSGAELISLGNVSLIGANVFDGNSGSGLYVDAAGSISAENLTASNNGETGATLVAVGNVELTGTNVFDNNALSGLFVDTGGNIGLENISAEGNSGYGAELIGSGGDVSIMGTNIFNGNAFSGLYAEGVNIYAENLTANGNGILGGFGNGADLYSLNTFILAGVNTFSGNNNSGLFVDAGGNIDAENITAIGNGAGGVLGHGAEFYSLNGAFNLTGSSAFNGNYSNGLVVDVNSDIYIFHANAMSNGGHGMYLGTDGDAHVTCGLILNNGLRAINTGITGRLILYGVNFGGNPNLFIGIDPFQLRLISNSCFTYPGTYIPNEEVPDKLRIRYVYNVDGKDVGLDCEYYDGTQLYLSNGDGAYVPCPIIDNVRLDRVLETDLADAPPLPDKYVSGMNVRVTWEGEKFFEPIDSTDVVWFVNPGSFAGYEAARWDGRQWVDITNEIPPFITVFFRIPPEMRNTNFSIMYWDDTEWIELTSRTHLGEGQIVRVTGRSAFSPDFGETNPNGIYYIAEVNFIGRFVLVEK